MGKGWLLILHPDDRPSAEAEIAQAIATGLSFESEHRIRRADGAYLWHRVLVSVIKKDEEVNYLVAVVIDNHLRRLHEERLAQGEEQQTTIAKFGTIAMGDVSPEVLLELAVQLVADGLNSELTKIAEFIPQQQQFVLRAGRGWRPGLVGSARTDSGLGSQDGYTLLHVAGVLVHDLRGETRFRAAPLLTEHGVISGISVIIPVSTGAWGVLSAHSRQRGVYGHDDLHYLQGIANILGHAIERERQRTAILSTICELREALNAKDEFIAAASHELRTPAAVIYGDAGLLSRRYETLREPERKELLQDLLDESNRLTRTVENLLQVSRRDGRLQQEPLQVENIVTSAIRTLHRTHRRRRVRMRIEDDLPAVTASAFHLEQVIVNLLVNADKYSPARSTIDVRAQSRGHEILVSVEDRGPGVPPQELDLIFSKYYKASNSQGVNGLGLGLAVCRQLVEAQGGQIWAENRPRSGLSVHFSLPSAHSALAAAS
jgi:signal transduction histidine kinase